MADTTASTANARASAAVVNPLISVTGLHKHFGGIVALDGVDLTVVRGEVHALVGENGSGKSTLVRILCGALVPDAGELTIDGQAMAALASPRKGRELGIACVSQELTLAPDLSVAENISMGCLPTGGPMRRLVRWDMARRIARKALDDLGVAVDERRRVGELRIDIQQEVEIARALAMRCRLLILDEATSSLSEAAAERLLMKVRRLRDQGVSTLFVSHRLQEVFACAERATVLRDGHLVDTVAVADVDEQGLVRRMVGRDIADLFGRRNSEPGASALEVRDLSSADGLVRSVGFSVGAGEVVGVAGLAGSGKSELALALAGGLHGTGTVRVNNARVRLGKPRSAIAAGIGFVPEDRKRAALFPSLSVGRNLAAAWLSELKGVGFIKTRRERVRIGDAMRAYDVKAPSSASPIGNLSGGNQQKVVFARIAALQPAVLVLAEPTRGVDIGAKAEIYRAVQRLADDGTGIVVISSELPELLGLADRVLVMFRGSVAAQFDAAEATEARIAHVATGGHNGPG